MTKQDMNPSKPSEWIEQEVQKYIAKYDVRDPTLKLIAYIHPIMDLLDLLHSQGKIGMPDNNPEKQ